MQHVPSGAGGAAARRPSWAHTSPSSLSSYTWSVLPTCHLQPYENQCTFTSCTLVEFRVLGLALRELLACTKSEAPLQKPAHDPQGHQVMHSASCLEAKLALVMVGQTVSLPYTLGML